MKTRALHVEVPAELSSIGSVSLEDGGNRSLEPAKSLYELEILKYLWERFSADISLKTCVRFCYVKRTITVVMYFKIISYVYIVLEG
jgi:hypothetical protein